MGQTTKLEKQIALETQTQTQRENKERARTTKKRKSKNKKRTRKRKKERWMDRYDEQGGVHPSEKGGHGGRHSCPTSTD